MKIEESDISGFLKRKAKLVRCPVCGNNEFSLLDGTFFHNVDSTLNGKFEVPSIATFCTECGLLNFHARKFIELEIEKEYREMQRAYLRDKLGMGTELSDEEKIKLLAEWDKR
jgi:predicted nucleic-acid-binding Zn-ribbon protein